LANIFVEYLIKYQKLGTKTNRIEVVRAYLGLTKTQMAQLMGIDQSYYGHILREDGKGNLRIEHLERLLSAKSISPLWVLTGQGEMILGISTEFTAQNEPTEDQIEALYNLVKGQEGSDFDTQMTYLAKFICAQVMVEFPEAESLENLSYAARAYIRAVKRLPDSDFMEILGIRDPFGQGEGKQALPLED